MGLINSKEIRELTGLARELSATAMRVSVTLTQNREPDPEEFVVLRGSVERMAEIAEQIKERPGSLEDLTNGTAGN